LSLDLEFDQTFFDISSSYAESRFLYNYTSQYDGADFQLDPNEVDEIRYFPIENLAPIEMAGKIDIGFTSYTILRKVLEKRH
jgi:hypothetical protein